MEERVADATLVHRDDPQPGALGLNGAGQAGGSGADHQQVEGAVIGGSLGAVVRHCLGLGDRDGV